MTTPETVGMSRARLARLDDVMKRRYVDSGDLPGILTQVYRKGEMVHTGMAGHMDLERSKPMREDAIFRIYSMSKPITSVALMMLVEEGALGLDDAVATHIPEWKDLGVYASGMPTLLANAPPSFITTQPERPMKVVDLVTHTSGLTYGFMMRTSVDAAYRKLKINDFQTPGGLSGMMSQLATLPLEFSPGTAWNYSVSIDVMGYLVEKLSGMSFGEFLRTRLFEPLGMTDTAFWVPPEKLDRFCSCYQPKKGGGLDLQDDAGKSTYAKPPLLESGGGGLVSTLSDYMRFCRMMLNGGSLDGVQILSPKTVELFSLNHLPEGQQLADMAPPGLFSEAGYSGIGFSIGCGVNVDVAKTRLPGTLGEYFWGGAASTAFWIDPKEDLTVVFMTQVIGTDARLTLRRDLRTLVYSAMTESYA
ncbi:MAG TPA: serine hydrolase domain-containing protein [Caulobacteraceae bacterium]|jgi:CubicO group peptidase (beta-lactamase class C family)|nr:serine hydrolase domain-containing protein [Caulobacteraceae bacterium]